MPIRGEAELVAKGARVLGSIVSVVGLPYGFVLSAVFKLFSVFDKL